MTDTERTLYGYRHQNLSEMDNIFPVRTVRSFSRDISMRKKCGYADLKIESAQDWIETSRSISDLQKVSVEKKAQQTSYRKMGVRFLL